MSKQVFGAIPKLTVKGEALHQLAQASQGAYEQNVLRLAANVVDRETITVGPESFQLVVLATDTNVNSTSLDNTNAESTETITAHGLSVGALLRCENEFLRVKQVVNANTVVLTRGYAGSTIASHTDGADLFKAAATALTAGKIYLPIGATLTPAAAGPQIATGFNALSTQGFTAVYASNALTITREANGLHVACSETLSGTDNVWSAANTYGGIEKGEVKFALAQRIPTATEVALDQLTVKFPFAPTFVKVTVQVTSSRAAKAWDGGWSVSGNTVTVTNAGTTDWATTDTVTVEVYGN
jgi:hypothetical protein